MAKINQKYFGNRNIGTEGRDSSDDKIGGEGIAIINFTNNGSWLATSGAPLSGLQLPAPTLPDGVQATWTVYYGASAVTTGAGKVGLVVGDTYTYAPFPGSVITVASTSGTNATFTVTNPGSTTNVTTDDQTVSITKLTGSGVGSFTVDVFTKVVNYTIDEKGSGYTGAETITVSKINGAGGTVPTALIELTTDSGAPGSSTNQENAIIAYANTDDNGSKVADIIKQRSTRRFKVKTADGTYICKLKSSAVSAWGEMTIVATDSAGGTYYVTKLGGRRCTVTQGTGTQFATGSSVPWTFDSATEDYSVKIANA
jgi:hypothetical protein